MVNKRPSALATMNRVRVYVCLTLQCVRVYVRWILTPLQAISAYILQYIVLNIKIGITYIHTYKAEIKVHMHIPCILL